MSKDKQVICPKCKEKLDKDKAIKHSNRYYHDYCLDLDAVEDRKVLIDYICKLYRIKAPTMIMLTQIKHFQEEYKCNLKGMLLTLKYFHETLGNPVREGDGIGIIPYIYDEARQHYINIANANNSSIDNEQLVTQKHVRIKSPRLETKQKITPIDISSL